MHSNGLAKESHPGRDSDPDLGTASLKNEHAKTAADAARPQPFRERRRARPLEDSRHEVLDPLNRLLVRYEKITHDLREAEQKYRNLFEDALVGMFQVSRAGRPLNLNPKMAQIHGYESPEQLLAEVSDVRQQLLVKPSQLNDWRISLKATGQACGIEAEIHCRDRAKKWISLNLRAVRNGQGRINYFEGTAEDITERKAAEERIQFLAYYDALTGLPNRTLFDEQLSAVIASARWNRSKAALLLIELVRFKIINDSLGHSFGDRLLQETAQRIRRGSGEDALIARVGGGEFAIVLSNVRGAPDAFAAAQQVLAELATEFSIVGHSLNVSFNIGISMFPENGMEGEALLQNADVALYSAKEDGPNRARMFSQEMNFHIMEQLTLENGLGMALDRNELFLLYQPQVNIRTGSITGLEALLRWQHPQLGLVPPGKFIGVAEHSGLIAPIGEWVLKTACSQAKKWQDAGLPAVPVAVNVSAVQFRQQGFRELIRGVLQDTGLDPKYLELELTESLLLTNADVMISILRELREMGVKLAIDDFGTGYSSLSYLRQFQVNRLKIDRSFVRDVAVNPDDAAIATAIIRMARALNLEVLAEGVENEAQLSFLRTQQCYDIQGFYFSRPVAVDQIVAKLQGAPIQPAASALTN